MKKLLVLIAFLSAPVFAENWDREQFNFKLQTKDSFGNNVSWRYRHYFGDSDKTHHQLGYKYDNWDFSYQYIEKKGRPEHRPRISVKLFQQENGFYFRPRVEYRDIEGKKNKKTNYFRVLTTLGYKGDFKSMPQFFATITDEFQTQLKEKCLVTKPTKKPNETAILNKTLYAK